MTRIPAAERLQRLLALLPWVAAHPGTPISEICARFAIEPARLRADLEVLWMVGLPPYTPDQLMEVHIEDDRLTVMLGEYFRRPLSLTPDQAAALVIASRGLLSVPGAESNGPLARGIAKLADALGAHGDVSVDVTLGTAEPDVLATVRRAAADGVVVDITYTSSSRDERTERTIEPRRVWSEGGHWYVAAHCRLAEGERVFRVDRIEQAQRGEDVAAGPAPRDLAGTYNPGHADPRITLALGPEVAWVAETYPVEDLEVHDDGTLSVVMPVSGQAWIERLLLTLGPRARVTAQTDGLGDAVAADAATRILERYQ